VNKSFTLIELIFVIIITTLLGVAVMVFPDNSLTLARDKLMKNIRLTQTLALLEDKYLDRPKNLQDVNNSKFWFKSFWQIYFTENNYTIFSDKAPFDGIPQDSEIIINPLDRNKLIIKLDNNIHITSNLTNWQNRILFDNLGRPFYDVKTTNSNPFNFMIQKSFQIKISKDSDSLCFQIEPISGYIHNENCKF